MSRNKELKDERNNIVQRLEKELKDERNNIVQGLEKAYEKLVAFKRQKNSPLVVSKNGKVVKIAPSKIHPTTTYKRKA